MQLSKLKCTLIHAFFLHIYNISRFRHFLKLLFNELSWEGCQLFKSNDHSLLFRSILLKFLMDIKEDLTWAKNHFLNFFTLTITICINWVKGGARLEFINRRNRKRMFQTDLWCSKNQRFSKISQHLSSQKMEVVSWVCNLSYLKIDILTSQGIIITFQSIISLRVYILKESFDVASRVLRACSIKSMRQKENHSTLS